MVCIKASFSNCVLKTTEVGIGSGMCKNTETRSTYLKFTQPSFEGVK